MLFVTNDVRAGWRGVSGHPVVAAEQTDAGLGQWVWEHDGLTWIATGTVAMQPGFPGLVAAEQQVKPDEPWDYSTLGGALYRNLAIVPGFTYMDDPVANVLDHIMSTFVGDCARHLYAGRSRRSTTPTPSRTGPQTSGSSRRTSVAMCLDGGFMDQLAAALQSMGLVDDVIGDVPVRRSATDVVVVDDDRVPALLEPGPGDVGGDGPVHQRRGHR